MSDSGPASARLAPAYERNVGIELYSSDLPGITGKLRTLPLDFVVDEVGRLPVRTQKGRFTIARVRSQNWENNHLVRAMARELSISRRRIGFAGTKDKRAVASQFFSFKHHLERVAAMDLPGVQVLNTYRANRPLAVGMLRANRFTLRVRELDRWDPETLERRLNDIRRVIQDQGGFPNFFGLQRFGTVRPITHRVGAALVRRDYETAARSYVTHINPLEPESEQAARRGLAATEDWAPLLKTFPSKLTFEKTLVYHLAHHPGDYVGALAKLPDNLLQMFVHAYQSELFNRMVSRRMREGLPLDRPVEGDIVVPVDRHGQPDHSELIPVTDFNLPKLTKRCLEGQAYVTGLLYGLKAGFAEGPMGEIERDIVDREQVGRQDFIIYELPHISSMGRRRPLLCRPLHLQIAVEDSPKALINGRFADQHNHERASGGRASSNVADPSPGPRQGAGVGPAPALDDEPDETPETPDPPRPRPYWQLSETETELTARLSFTLPKGSYATMLAREFMKAEFPTAY